jgi:hypothetical protein
MAKRTCIGGASRGRLGSQSAGGVVQSGRSRSERVERRSRRRAAAAWRVRSRGRRRVESGGAGSPFAPFDRARAGDGLALGWVPRQRSTLPIPDLRPRMSIPRHAT